MLMCNETVTLIHHIKDVDGDTYTCTVYECASWYKKRTISTSEKGASPSNTYDARIMTNEDIAAELGDYVAFGIVKEVTKPSDIKDLDCFRITAISDNRRGMLKHWRFSGQ